MFGIQTNQSPWNWLSLLKYWKFVELLNHKLISEKIITITISISVSVRETVGKVKIWLTINDLQRRRFIHLSHSFDQTHLNFFLFLMNVNVKAQITTESGRRKIRKPNFQQWNNLRRLGPDWRQHF